MKELVALLDRYFRRALFLPEEASSIAPTIDHLHYFVITTTLVASALVGMTALFFFLRYRRNIRPASARVESPWWFELAIVAVPLAFFLLWFVIGFRNFIRLSTPPQGAIDIYVMAKQWMWKFSYPDGPNSIGTLRVPARRPVRLLLVSRDVIHSLFIPAFRVKHDVLPGRYSQLWFEATAPGRYDIFCTEYCGAGHSGMRGEVVVMEPRAYDAWLAAERHGVQAGREGPPSTMVAEGERLAVAFGCLKCHTVDGSRHLAPSWRRLYGRDERLADGSVVRVDEAYLTESMMDPPARIVAGFQPIMPSFFGQLGGPDAAALVEYIKSLRGEVADGRR